MESVRQRYGVSFDYSLLLKRFLYVAMNYTITKCFLLVNFDICYWATCIHFLAASSFTTSSSRSSFISSLPLISLYPSDKLHTYVDEHLFAAGLNFRHLGLYILNGIIYCIFGTFAELNMKICEDLPSLLDRTFYLFNHSSFLGYKCECLSSPLKHICNVDVYELDFLLLILLIYICRCLWDSSLLQLPSLITL